MGFYPQQKEHRVLLDKLAKKAADEQKLRVWSIVVRLRDGNVCFVCGRFGVEAHHIISKRYKATRYDVDNGVSLCIRPLGDRCCHRAAHNHLLKFSRDAAGRLIWERAT